MPKIMKGDKVLTSEPVIAEVIYTNQLINANETVRQTQETNRQNNTTTAIANAQTATNNANQAITNMNNLSQTVTNQETTRQSQEETRQTNTATAISNANNIATTLANETLKIFKSSVTTYADLATTYPTPENGWTVTVTNESVSYRYNGTTSVWVNLGYISAVDIATSSELGVVKGGKNIDIEPDGTLNALEIGDLTQLQTTSKTDLVGAINEIDGDVGDKTTLNTTDKSSTVNAINEVNEQLAAIVEQQDVLQATLSQDYKSIFSTGTGKDSANFEQTFNNKVEGQSSIKLEGLTLLNEATYNTDTWAEWTKDSGVVGDSTGLEFTANGTGYIYGRYTSKFKNGTKYGMLLNSVSNNLSSQILMENYIVDTSVPVVNQGVTGNVKVVFTTKSSISINKLSLYISSGTLGTKGKIRDIRVFELPTGSQIETDFNTLTANELSLKYTYINGLQGTGSHKIVSRTKNLFDTNIANWEQGNMQTTLGSAYSSLKVDSSTVIRTKLYKNIKPNTQHTLSSTTFAIYKIGLRYFDSNGCLVDYVLSQNAQYTGTSPTNTRYISFVITRVDGANITVNEMQNVIAQFEEGTVATTYESYKSSELITTLPRQLHRLPNGVADTVEEVNNVAQVTYRNNEYSLLSTDIGLDTSLVNVDVVTISYPTDFYGYNNGSTSSNANRALLDGNPTVSSTSDSVDSINKFYANYSTTKFGYIVAKGTYTLATAQTAFTSKKLVYQKLVPITYKNGENGFSQVGNLEVFKGGTIYIEPVSLKECTNPKTYITYNLSKQAVVMGNSGEVTEIEKFLVGRVIVESGSNSNGKYLKFDDGTLICYHIIESVSLPITTPIGNLYRSTDLYWTFPSTFIDNYPIPLIQPILSGSYLIGTISSTAQTNFYYQILNPISATLTVKTRLFAIGRWK